MSTRLLRLIQPEILIEIIHPTPSQLSPSNLDELESDHGENCVCGGGGDFSSFPHGATTNDTVNRRKLFDKLEAIINN